MTVNAILEKLLSLFNQEKASLEIQFLKGISYKDIC
jgi:hypothetical protein